MKILNTLCLLSLLATNAFAEPTPAGSTPTFKNQEGKPFTLYYLDGTPVPPNTRMFITGIGVNLLINEKGQTIGTAFNTPEEAQKSREATPDCSGAVFGPGPGGIPAGCPGSSNTSASAGGTMTEVDEDAYNQKVYELGVVLYGASEIGAKSCKGAGEEMPGSLGSFFGAVKSYSTGERARDKLLNDRVAALDKKMQELMSGDASALQTESIQLQIDTVLASIESVNGASGRIPLREKLILAALKSTEANSKENIATMDAYFNLRDKALIASLDAAKAACERKKKIEKCEVDEEGNEKCTQTEEKDPVPGCDAVQAQIPVMKSGALQSYGEVYLSKMQSAPLNDRMQMFADDMKNTMAALPRSNDANYDWSTPMESALESLEKARKKSGAKCPNGEEALANVEAAATSKDPKVIASSREQLSSATTDSGKISKASEAFMSSIGIESNPAAAKGFMEAWKASDSVIGQAANRPEYFDYITEKTNAVLEMDRIKLQNLMIAKAKLEKYLSSLKKTLAQGSNTPKASGGSGSTEKQVEKAKVVLNAQNAQEATAGGITVGNVTAPEAKALGIATQASLSLSSMKDTNGMEAKFVTPALSNFSSGKVNGGEGLSLSGSSMAIAKKSLSTIAQNSKKKEAGVSSILPSGSSGSGSGTTSSKEKTKIAAQSSNGASKGAQGQPSAFSSAMETTFEKFKNSDNAQEIYKAASYGGSRPSSSSDSYGGSYGGSYGNSSSSEKRSYQRDLGHTAPIKSGDKSSSASKYSSISAERSSSEGAKEAQSAYEIRDPSSDAQTLSQSITAKKFRKKDEYEAKDNDSLFERVTKAYIRSYEKVEAP